MSCTTNCSESTPNQVYNLQYSYSAPCTTSDCPNGSLDSKCVIYKGGDLANSGIETDDSVEVALQKIDEILSETSGNYSTYSYNCITPATTEAEFVESITDYVCTLNTTVTDFIDTTYVEDQAAITVRLGVLEVPEITCTSAGVTDTDTITEVLNKYCTKFGEIDDAIDISGITWNTCYGTTTPDTIKEGFEAVLDQICQTKALITVSALPVFNNTGSCLASPGATDSLISTIGKIKTRLCLTPEFDINDLTWICIEQPSVTTTDLQAAFQAVLDKIDDISQVIPTFSDDFEVTNVDDGAPCLGKTIALATPLDVDRLVAVDEDDGTPGTLIDKIEAGDDTITIDTTTTPGKMLITAQPSSQGKVFGNIVDDTLGFLDQKVQGKGSPDGILTLGTVYNTSTKKVDFTPGIDTNVLLEALFTLIETDQTFKDRFCAIVNSCPTGCSAPQSPQATYVGESV